MSIYDNAGVVLIPSGYKAGTTDNLYSVLPANGNGDFNATRGSTATRINKDGFIESVAADVPRLDYPLIDGVVQDCPALLLEPQRMNSLLQSNQFNTTWALSSSIALTSGQSGVGGSTDAWLLKKTDASSRYIIQNITLISSTYSYSVFAKKESGNWLYVRLSDSGGSLASTSYFDLENGVVGSTSADSLSIHSYKNGWYRCEVKFTHSIGFVRMYPAVGDGSPSGGSGGEGIYIQNAQLEQGSYPTSYIPTLTSAVTRSADVCNGSGTSADFNDSEGVLFTEIAALSDTTTAYTSIGVGSGSSSNRIGLGFNPSSQIYVYKNTTTSWVATQNANIELFNKVALSYNTNDNEFWLNGFKVSTNTTIGDIAQPNELRFSASYGGEQFFGNTKQLMTFKTALTDSELEQITSWTSFGEMAKGQLYTIE